MRKDILMASFILTYVFSICTALHFFLWICVAFWLSFPEGLTSFSISCKTDLLATNLFVFVYLQMPLFCLHFWRIVLLDTEFLFDSYFSFCILNMSFYCLLASMVFDEKPAVHCIDVCLYTMNCCSLAAFKIFFLA